MKISSFKSEVKAPDHKHRSPQCKERERLALQMNGCADAARKEKGIVGAGPLSGTAQSGDMTGFFLCPTLSIEEGS